MLITSTQNQHIKALAKLKNKKDRDATRQFLVEGAHMVEEAYQAGILLEVFTHLEGENYHEIPTHLCSGDVLARLSQTKSGSALIGLCRQPEWNSHGANRTLLLDRIQDPGNLGTLIRSAYAFGMDQVLLSIGCADPYSPKTLQSTQGAIFHIPVQYANLEKEIPLLKIQDIPVYGAALHHEAISLQNVKPANKFGIVIGNEGQGISPLLLDKVSDCVYIEMQDFESLNAAVAGSILMYHFQFFK